MILDLNISYGEVIGILSVIGLIPIFTLISLYHLDQNSEKSKLILKVISILLMVDCAILILHQLFYARNYGALLYIGIGVFMYALIATGVSFRKTS